MAFHSRPSHQLILLLLTLHLGSASVSVSAACSDRQCITVLHKCSFMNACTCGISRQDDNCSCCAQCSRCLGDLFNKCCSCIGLCPKKQVDLDEHDSVIGELPEPFPHLFNVLTTDSDPEMRWVSYTQSLKEQIRDKNVKVASPRFEQDLSATNCTVAYGSKCLSNVQCKRLCSTMGANSYRFFFNGCCECVGENCFKYGFTDIRCLSCPASNSIGG